MNCGKPAIPTGTQMPKLDPIKDQGRTKYDRLIIPKATDLAGCYVDVYDVLLAFNVTCPARQHAIKKLLCAGIRGKGNEVQDLEESIVAINRSIVIAKTEGEPLMENPLKHVYFDTAPQICTFVNETKCVVVSIQVHKHLTGEYFALFYREKQS